MASVTLSRGWLNLASDPSQYVAAPADVDEDHGRQVDVRQYVGGRMRAVSRAGSRRTLQITLHRITPADIETLRGWLGETVCWRDSWGRKMWGVFPAISPDYYLSGSARVELTLAEVTYDEAV